MVSCWASQMVSLIVLGLLDGFLLDLAEGSLMASCWTSWMVYLMAFARFTRRFLARLCRGLLQ
jgi:hypothetical protein